jgi:hypothetical protein
MKRYGCLLFLQVATQFGSTFFLTVGPVVRYLQPLSLLTILSLAAITKVLVDRGKGETQPTEQFLSGVHSSADLKARRAQDL